MHEIGNMNARPMDWFSHIYVNCNTNNNMSTYIALLK